MDRHESEPRKGWRTTIEEQGLVYWETPLPDGESISYWNEEAFYSFTEAETYELEAAARVLQQEMLIEAGDFIIEEGLLDRMGIPGWAASRIRETWEQEPPMLYGRFDFAYGPEGLKLLEYNADTPTALLESAVIQWEWVTDVFGDGADQWNSLHEALVARWREMAEARRLPGDRVHFLHTGAEDSGEDFMTVAYLADTARQAGIEGEIMQIEQVSAMPKGFLDLAGQPIRTAFKLYPWEWMVHERFALPCLDRMGPSSGQTVWIEPIWKMLWSNKGILPVLWHLYPDHENLLPAYFADEGPMEFGVAEQKGMAGNFVRKPLLAREGADAQVIVDGRVAETGPQQGYGEEGYVVQRYTPLDDGYGKNPVLGVWMVDMEPVGCGIRESDSLITNNASRFVPNVIAD